METIVSSVALDEEVKVKKAAVDVNEDKMEESLSPVITRPPHTSPDFTFASEVTTQKTAHDDLFSINQCILIHFIHAGAAEDHLIGSPEFGC